MVRKKSSPLGGQGDGVGGEMNFVRVKKCYFLYLHGTKTFESLKGDKCWER